MEGSTRVRMDFDQMQPYLEVRVSKNSEDSRDELISAFMQQGDHGQKRPWFTYAGRDENRGLDYWRLDWIDNSPIDAERQRQVQEEGYTPESDDTYVAGELVNAAIAYLQAPYTLGVSPFWPWMPEYYKPTPNDRVRELTKAGALIQAEIDRLKRLENQTIK